jgi:predicted SnoaL-like aldol condensation-catalyzing enzyme
MRDDSKIDARKQTALAFLRQGRAGNRAALEQLVHPTARHHNPYFAAGMPALLDAMVAAATQAPERASTVQRVIGEGDFVAVHSHVRPHPAHTGFAVVHVFRFEGDRIAELWDVGQPIPEPNPNADGMF